MGHKKGEKRRREEERMVTRGSARGGKKKKKKIQVSLKMLTFTMKSKGDSKHRIRKV